MGNEKNKIFCRRISPIQPGEKLIPQTHLGQYPPHRNVRNNKLTTKPPSAMNIRTNHPKFQERHNPRMRHLMRQHDLLSQLIRLAQDYSFPPLPQAINE